MPLERPPVEVVALVASAGGLEALTTVLRSLDPHLPVPVLVQQHLGGQASVLPRILARRTGRTIVWAADGGALESGRVVVCPARSQVEVLPDLTLSVTGIALSGSRPHDALLTSLADSVGPAAVAVVLSGSGSDGAAGVAALRAAGGIVLAQSEDTAEYASMPAAAAQAGADLVLPLHEIGAVVTDVVRGEALPRPDAELDAIRAVFGEEGRVAAFARDVDWSRSPLGPVAQWSPVLRSVLQLTMRSARPAALLWGEDQLFFSNEAGLEISAVDRPVGMARPFAERFPHLLAAFLPVFERVRAGESVLLPSVRTEVVRGGRRYDVWLDVAYTPVHEGDGSVAGIHSTYIERTREVLAARRLAVLNALSRTPRGRDRRAALVSALEVLADADDVPFCAAYLLDGVRARAHRVAVAGAGAADTLAPRELRRTPGAPWPLHEVVQRRHQVLVDDVADRFHGHRVGPDPVAPESAVVHPLRDDADGTVVGALLLVADPRTPLDAPYREFLTLVGDTIGARVAEAHAGQRERQRLDRLTELDRARTHFFSNVSHEFRTPLTLLLAPLQQALGRADDLPADLAADLELAERNARRLVRLVGSLLDVSQLEAGRLHARLVPTDLAALTAEIASMFRSAATAAGLTLAVDAPPLPEPVWLDREMWEKIVSNLLSNALKFTWEGSVEVGLRALPKHAELTVRDTGVGIPADQVPHVFKRFHRVPETGGRTQDGAGIGLSLVDELVRRHSGRVRVTSAAGEGTTFTVWVPLGRRPHVDDDGTPTAAAGAVASAMAEEARHWDAADADRPPVEAALAGSVGRAAGARVLVVDDNADMREYLSRLLAPAWDVTVARDGLEALELARREPPDLVLSDVMMPRMDGFALLRELRKDEQLSTTPVVLLTARAGEEAAIEGLLAGADAYLVKPFSARELLALVGGQLDLAAARRVPPT